jgi:hypothetical protein
MRRIDERLAARLSAALAIGLVVTFSKTVWPEVMEIKEGATTKLNPGMLKVSSTKPFRVTVNGDDGRAVAKVSSAISRIALPAGRYTFEAAGQKFSVELKEGQDVEMKDPLGSCRAQPRGAVPGPNRKQTRPSE